MAQLESQSSTKPIGTGPFSLVEWVPNDHLTVQRNPHYWRAGLPYLDGVTYRPIAEDQSRENSLQVGDHRPDGDARPQRHPGPPGQFRATSWC